MMENYNDLSEDLQHEYDRKRRLLERKLLYSYSDVSGMCDSVYSKNADLERELDKEKSKWHWPEFCAGIAISAIFIAFILLINHNS